MKILVLDRSWNIVGDLQQDGDDYLVTNGSVIRRWGTTKGLGEIAMNGPTSDTILDPIPLIKFHKSKLIFQISCDESKWKK